MLFLYEGWKMSLRPNMLKQQVAAIQACLGLKGWGNLSTNKYVKKFLLGVKQMVPPVKHRFWTWSLSKALRALTKPPFEPLKLPELHFLSSKAAFIIAVTSDRRVSELAALSAKKELCIFQKESVSLRMDPSFIPKVNSVFHLNQPTILP